MRSTRISTRLHDPFSVFLSFSLLLSVLISLANKKHRNQYFRVLYLFSLFSLSISLYFSISHVTTWTRLTPSDAFSYFVNSDDKAKSGKRIESKVTQRKQKSQNRKRKKRQKKKKRQNSRKEKQCPISWRPNVLPLAWQLSPASTGLRQRDASLVRRRGRWVRRRRQKQ